MSARNRRRQRSRNRQRMADVPRATLDPARNPGDYRPPVTRDGIALATNPNAGKRDAAPLNWTRRTLSGDTLRQSRATAPDGTPTHGTILRTRPVLTPTGRRARRNGEPRVTESFTAPRDLRWIAREPS